MSNQRYFFIAVLYFLVLTFLMVQLFGYGIYYFMVFAVGTPKELEAFQYATIAILFSFIGLFLSYVIFFLTIGKIYKKFNADFNFKHPVLYTSIVIFFLGNILFYFAMLIWVSVK